MFSKKRKRDDVIGPSTGWVKWATRFFRFILYPFIHPVWFVVGLVIIAVLVIGIPSYYGVEFETIPQWYGQQWNKYYGQMKETWSNKISPIKGKADRTIKEISTQGVNVSIKSIEKKPSKKEMVIYESPKAVNRRLFEQSQEIPVDVKSTIENKKEELFKRDKNLGLVYLEIPQDVEGIAKIVNANELKVDSKRMFLYGIYVAPKSDKGIKALQYLREDIEGKKINCIIGAYTNNGIPTAICYLDSVNINQRLVDFGYSADVSLN